MRQRLSLDRISIGRSHVGGPAIARWRPPSHQDSEETVRNPWRRLVRVGTAACLAVAWGFPVWGTPSAGASPVGLQLGGGLHVPADGPLRDLYGAMPSFGAGARLSEQAWGDIEARAAIRFASARPSAGPFVADVTSRWLSVPLSLSVRRRFGTGGLLPFARVGVLAQWNRESFRTDVGGDVSEASSSQLRPGLVLAAGLAPRPPDRGLSWFLQGSWQWVPGDRVVETPSESREVEGMDLGGFTIHFGLSL